jgi:hypothetical protein
MGVTDRDRSLAAELGLYLVLLPETSDDRRRGADPSAIRIPQNWAVKSAIDDTLVGILTFTETDCLYATRYATGMSGIEESVADALRWMTRVRHVRMGDGVRRESPADRARAVTECGAMATGADFDATAAQTALMDDQPDQMCPMCLTAMKKHGVLRDVLKRAQESGSSTPRQRDFIRRLLDEAACCGRPYLMDARSIDHMSIRTASATIDALRALKARHWMGDL